MLRKTGEEAVKATTFSPETKNRARQECPTPFGTASLNGSGQVTMCSHRDIVSTHI